MSVISKDNYFLCIGLRAPLTKKIFSQKKFRHEYKKKKKHLTGTNINASAYR